MRRTSAHARTRHSRTAVPCVALPLVLASLLLSGPASARLVGGIEIGGSGAKGFVYELANERLAPASNGQISAGSVVPKAGSGTVLYGGMGVISALSEDMLADSAIDVIAAQVKGIAAALAARGVAADDVFVVGSSSVEKMANTGDLFDAVRKATGLSLSFVSPEQEGAFGLLDALSEEANPSRVAEGAIAVDVGAGNVKAAYIEQGQFHTLEIPFGTDNLRQYDNGGEAPCTEWRVATCFLQPYFSVSVDRLLRAHPRFRDLQRYPNVYLTGGTAWAVSRMVRLADASLPYSTITYADLRSAVTKVDALERVLATELKKLRDKSSAKRVGTNDLALLTKQAALVGGYYGKQKDQLKGGIALYLWLFEAMGRDKSSIQYKELNRQGDWLRFYVMHKQGLLKDLAVPDYRPSIHRRSHDIER